MVDITQSTAGNRPQNAMFSYIPLKTEEKQQPFPHGQNAVEVYKPSSTTGTQLEIL